MKERLMNNIGLKILAFLIAGLLWLTVVNIDNPITDQTYKNIPVSVINAEVLASEETPKTYQIVDDTQTVDVTVKAKRSVLSKIEAKDIVAVADMKELTLNTQIPIQVTVKGNEYKEAYSNPRNLQIKLEDEETKKFPIVPKTTGTVRDGYVLGSVTAVPEQVSIRGPKSVVETISKVEAKVNVSGLSQDMLMKSELKLYDQDNEEIDQTLLSNNLGTEGVSINIELFRTKKIPLEFDTSQIQAADGYEFSKITYEPQEISISGEQRALRKVDKIEIPASALEMNDIKEKTEKVVDISSYLPEEIELADENAGSVVVTVFVEKDGAKTFEITPGAITVDNLTKGLVLDYKTADALEVQVRGPKDALEGIKINECVSIDLKAYVEPGIYDVPVTVKLPEHCTLEKPVTVSIELKELETHQ